VAATVGVGVGTTGLSVVSELADGFAEAGSATGFPPTDAPEPHPATNADNAKRARQHDVRGFIEPGGDAKERRRYLRTIV
jgi:hypothetical protein